MKPIDDGYSYDCGAQCVHIDSQWPFLPGVAWWLFTCLCAFVVLVAKTRPHLSLDEIAFASIPVGTIFAGWITFLASCLLNELGYVPCFVLRNAHLRMLTILRSSMSVSLGTFIVAYVAWDNFPEFRTKIGPAFKKFCVDIPSNWVLYATLTAWGFLMVPLYLTRFFPEDDQGNVYSGGSCWADMPIHMHFANSFIYGRNQDVSWSMQSPIFAGEAMTYPFIPDWHAGVMYWMGDSMRHAMMWPGMFMFFSMIGLLFCFTRRMSRSDVAAVISTAVLVFAGGQGGINLLKEYGYERVMQEFDPIQDDVNDKGNVFWFAFMPHVYLPQRGATFAYPMVLAAFLMVWAATNRAAAVTSAARSALLMLAAVCCATLPMVQAHSFIGAALVMLTVFLCDAYWWVRSPRVLWSWISAGIAALVLAAPQLSQFMHMVSDGNGPSGKGSFMEFRPIWKPPGFSYPADTYHFFWFWWRSLGPCVPLFLLALLWNSISAVRAYTSAVKAVIHHVSNTGPLPPMGAAVPRSMRKKAKGDDDLECTDSDAGSAAEAEVAEAGMSPSPSNIFGATDEMPFSASSKVAVAYKDAFPASRKHPMGYLFGGGVQEPLEAEELLAYFTGMAQSYAPVAAAAAAGDRVMQTHNAARDVDVWKWTLAGAVVWAFGNYVMMQPWDRDNCKLLYIAMFIMCGSIGDLLSWPLTNAARVMLGRPHPSVAKAKAGDDGQAVAPTTSFSGEKLPLRGAHGYPTVLKRSFVALPLAALSLLSIAAYAYYGWGSGLLSVLREYRLYHVLYDKDFKAMGEYIRRHVPPKSVMMHHDTHITPVGLYGGHPSLISYNGWMWSHGYDYYDRDTARKTVIDHMLKDSDQNAYNVMRRWGTRYVLGENAYKWPRDESAEDFDPDVYLDGSLKRVFTAGRFELFEVLGYSFPPA